MFDREKAIAIIKAGDCACPGCRGQLSADDHSPRGWRQCQTCRCAWKVETIGSAVYACHIEGPVHTRPRIPNRELTKADYDGHEDLR